MKPPGRIAFLLKLALLAGLALWALVSLVRIVQQTLSATGGNDLYTYWYAGHFIREGKDLYRAFIDGELPAVPVRYLDRTVTGLDGVIFPGLVPAPASPPAAFYLMAPLAFLSWKTAKLVWLVCNFLFLGLIPFLLVRFFSAARWLSRLEFAGLACLLAGMTATRSAAAGGQVTFVVLDLMLGTVILAERRPWLAGLLLGLALSKYSLSIGILVLFIFFEPKIRLVLAAVLVQLAGVAALLLLGHTSLLDFVYEYAQMVNLHANMEGIHLAGLFPRSGLDTWLGLGLTLAVALPLILWRWKYHRKKATPHSTLAGAVLAVGLSLWALLAVYHRAYDAVVMIAFLDLAAFVAKQPGNWKLSKPAWTGLLAFGALAGLLLLIPSGSVVRGLLPDSLETLWGRTANLVTTLLIAVALVASIALLFRLRPEEAPENPSGPA